MKFWQRYLRDHARYGTRVLHFVGNCLAVLALVLGVVMLDPVIPVVGVLIARTPVADTTGRVDPHDAVLSDPQLA